MKIIKKILLGLFILISLLAVYIQFAPPKTYDIKVPEVTISKDSTVLAKGEYLIYGPAHCFGCHSRKEDSTAMENGAKVVLAGGKYFPTPLGNIYIPNITPDKETGIGNLTNDQISRAMRYSINHHGNVMIPAMPFTNMSEEDVSAIISYLKVQSPVKNKVPKTKYTFLGKALTQFLLKPYNKSNEIPKSVKRGNTVAYGEYLVNSVANCRGCHTTFSMKKMDFEGVPLSGGTEMVEKIYKYKTPNLTPDPETGHIVNWSEEQFIARFKLGKTYPDSPMPWDAFSKMSEDDLGAIYKYLQTIKPCKNKVEPIITKL